MWIQANNKKYGSTTVQIEYIHKMKISAILYKFRDVMILNQLVNYYKTYAQVIQTSD